MTSSERLFRVVRLAYPREFLQRFEAGMYDTFARDYARARSAGVGAMCVFLTLTLVESAWSGLAERASAMHKEITMRSFPVLDWRDAWRALRAAPVVSTMAVLSLSLGIGANTALFSILNALVLKTLPVRDPGQLVLLGEGDWTNPIWEDIRDRRSAAFDGALAWGDQRFNLSDRGQTDFVAGAYVSGSFFRVLGVPAARGRMLDESDDVRGGGASGAVAVVSDRFWRKLGADPQMIGRTLSIEHVAFTVVGIMPAGFVGPEVGRASDIIVPLGDEPLIRGRESELDGHWTWWLSIMARLKPGQSLDDANRLLSAMTPQIRLATMPDSGPPDYVNRYLHDAFTATPAGTGLSALRSRYEQPLTIVLIVVGAVLLIACANIANLLLTRASARRHELVLRMALGASRARIARQLLLESVMLAGMGAALGLVIAQLGSALLVHQLGASLFLDTSIDWRVLGFTTGVTAATALLFGLAPALGVSRLSPNEALKEQGRSIAGDRTFGVRHVLVVSQVALSLALVVAAGLFVRTLSTVLSVPLGFDAGSLTAVDVEIPATGAPDQRLPLFERLQQAAEGVPGVRRAGLSVIRPVSGSGWNTRVELDGGPTLSERDHLSWVNCVTPGWFATYGMHLIAGRDLASTDRRHGPLVVVVNEAFAKRFFNGENPIGRQFRGRIVTENSDAYEIVGLVSDAMYRRPREGPSPIIFVPLAQIDRSPTSLTLTVAVPSGPPSAVTRSLLEALGRVSPGAAFTMRPFDEQMRTLVAQERLVAVLSAFFGALALFLAGLGLYGVTSYGVTCRRMEIGIRMALGANHVRVVRLILRRVAWLVVTGTVAGAALSWWASRYIGASLLFGLGPRDPGTFVLAAGVLVVVGAFASWLPAQRAARIDPVKVLRDA